MSTAVTSSPKPKVIYPDSDGKPMADNTLQFRWIVTIEGGIDALFAQRLDVFVAGDLLWYPVEGDPSICTAPDTLVAFGRPKGYRGSYKQWEEGGIAPQVVFEVLSPSNRHKELIHKFLFYERYGVEEYYVYDPDHNTLEGWLRRGDRLEEVPRMAGWVSPRLGVRFELTETELELYGPDGTKFLSYVELAAQRNQLAAERDQALQQAAEQARRAEALAAQLRAQGIEPAG
jgi:Uma2 family endonuclease